MGDDQQAGQARWCILRTSPGRTLPLARSLAAAGFTVWTPMETQQRRRPRSKLMLDRDVAIVPTFVFARADRLLDLSIASGDPVSPHPPFSLFRHAGRVGIVADTEIESLREAEDAAALRMRKKQRKAYVLGTRVRADQPAFVGLSGVVEASDGKSAVVTFDGGFRVKIASWLLRTDEVQDGNPSGTAALAA